MVVSSELRPVLDSLVLAEADVEQDRLAVDRVQAFLAVFQSRLSRRAAY